MAATTRYSDDEIEQIWQRIVPNLTTQYESYNQKGSELRGITSFDSFLASGNIDYTLLPQPDISVPETPIDLAGLPVAPTSNVPSGLRDPVYSINSPENLSGISQNLQQTNGDVLKSIQPPDDTAFTSQNIPTGGVAELNPKIDLTGR